MEKKGLIGIALGVIVVLIVFPILITLQNANIIASYIYGMTTPLFGILTIYFVYQTYQVQKKQLDDTTNQLAENTKALQKQRFEDNFFKLLENHHRIVEAMNITDVNDSKNTVASKRECFKYIYGNIEGRINTNRANNIIITEQMVNSFYNEIQGQYKSQLHNYFRFIYHTLKFIKNANGIDNKMRYTNILRATLSPYEIGLIYYNGIHKHGKGLHPLIERFSFLKNRDESLFFIKPNNEYHPLAFASNEQRPIQLPLWKKKQEEKAKKQTNVS